MLARWPVFTQIALGFSLGALLLAGAASQTYGRVREMRALAVQALALEHASTLASDVLTQMLDGEAAVRGYASTRDIQFLQAGHSAAARASQNVAALESAGASRALPSNRLEQIVIVTGRIRRDVARTAGAFSRIERAAASGDRASLQRQIQSEPILFQMLRHDRNVLLSYTSSGARDALIRLDDARRAAALTLVVSTVAAIVLFLFAAGLVARTIALRLNAVTQALHDVTATDVPALIAAFGTLAEGDLSARFCTARERIDVCGRDEIAELAHSYNAVVGSLNDISTEFEAMTNRLRGTIEAMSGSAREIAGRSDAAVDAAMESLAAVSQIYAAVRGVADTAASQLQSIAAARSQIQELNYSAILIAQSAEFLAESGTDAQVLGRIARRNAFIAQDLRESVERVLDAMLLVEESAALHDGMADSATTAAAELCSKLGTIDASSRRSFAQSQSLRALASAFRNHGTELKEAS